MASKDPMLTPTFNQNYMNGGPGVDVGAPAPEPTAEQLEAAMRQVQEEVEKGNAKKP